MADTKKKPNLKRRQKTLYLAEEAISIISELAFYFDKPQSAVLEELILHDAAKVLDKKRMDRAREVINGLATEDE